ncbi:collagen alpha-1(I) chain-like [Myotis myotis]|uniref:collagen alpha-1(I) chain-like n=1 Tax=Myotis myotis TaxID=51298 RepID=UPI00174A458B|nr:collagen alpha-1(I) chain-like [Myotis myotis]
MGCGGPQGARGSAQAQLPAGTVSLSAATPAGSPEPGRRPRCQDPSPLCPVTCSSAEQRTKRDGAGLEADAWEPGLRCQEAEGRPRPRPRGGEGRAGAWAPCCSSQGAAGLGLSEGRFPPERCPRDLRLYRRTEPVPANLQGLRVSWPGPACPPAGDGRGVAAASGVRTDSREGGSPGSRLLEAPELWAAAPGLAASPGPPGGGRPGWRVGDPSARRGGQGPGAGGWAAGAGCSPLPSSCLLRHAAPWRVQLGQSSQIWLGPAQNRPGEGGSFLILGARATAGGWGRAAPAPAPPPPGHAAVAEWPTCPLSRTSPLSPPGPTPSPRHPQPLPLREAPGGARLIREDVRALGGAGEEGSLEEAPPPRSLPDGCTEPFLEPPAAGPQLGVQEGAGRTSQPGEASNPRTLCTELRLACPAPPSLDGGFRSPAPWFPRGQPPDIP